MDVKVAVAMSRMATALASCKVTIALVPSGDTAMYSGSTSSATVLPAQMRTPWARSADSCPLKAVKSAVCTVAAAAPPDRSMIDTEPFPPKLASDTTSASLATSSFIPLGVKVTMSGKAPTASDFRMFPVAASSSTTVPAFDLT